MLIWKKYYNEKVTKRINKNYIDDFEILLFKSHQICNNKQIYFYNYFKSYFIVFKVVQKLNLKKKVNKITQTYTNSFFNFIFILTNIISKCYQSCFYLMLNSIFLRQFFFVFYTIYFNFSLSNTNLQITDSNGNSKIFYSAGFLKSKGKQKILRRIVLVKFFRLLMLLKLKFIKNYPVALHLKNVGSYKFLIIKKLKQKFFIQIIKTFELHAYNGCRKKKERRKR